MLEHIDIVARDLNDAWFQAVKACAKKGREFVIEDGSFAGEIRRELDFVTIHVTYPGTRPLIPSVPPGSGVPLPTDMAYVERYVYYLIDDDVKPGEDYTYGERLGGQLEIGIEKYLKGGFRTNQVCFEIGQPSDISLSDPPCMRLIDTRIQDGKLHWYVYFRSWDVWGGLPSNLAGLQMVKEYMAESLNVKDGELVAISKGLHLYGHCMKFVDLLGV